MQLVLLGNSNTANNKMSQARLGDTVVLYQILMVRHLVEKHHE